MANLEITGNARPILAELDTLKENLEGVNLKYGEIEQAGKSVFSEAAKDAEELTGRVRKVDRAQGDYRKTLEQVGKQLERLKKGQAAATDPRDIKRYAAEIARAEQAYKELERAGVGGLDRVNDKADKSTRLFSGLRGVIAGAFAAFSLSEVATSFISEVKDFEKAGDELSSITGAVGGDLEFLKQQAVDLGVTTTKSATDAVKAFQIIASEKPELLQAKEALAAVTREAVALSEASGLELPDAAVALTGALNQFSAPADQAGRFINVLAAGSQKGAVAIPLITESLLKFGTVANKANVSVEQSVALVEALGEKGIKGAESGTQLRNILAILQKGADETNPAVVGLNTALDNLAGQQLTVNELTKKFGLESFVAADILINNRARVEELTQAVTGTSTAYEQQAVVTDNLEGSVAKLRNVYGSLVLSIENGEGPIAGALKSMVDGLSDFLRSLIENKAEVGRWLSRIGTAARVLGVVIAAVGAYRLTLKASNVLLGASAAVQRIYARTLVGSAASTRAVAVATRVFNTALRANPVGLIVTAVLALVAAYKLLTRQSKEQLETERLLREGKRELTRLVREERTQSDTLFRILKDGKATRQQQGKAVDLLLEKYGPYLGSIRTEHQLLGDLEEAQRRVNRGILEGAIARVKAQKIEEQTVKLIEKQIEVEQQRARVVDLAAKKSARGGTADGGPQFAGTSTAQRLVSSRVNPAREKLDALEGEAQEIANSIANFSQTIDASFTSLNEQFAQVDFSTSFSGIDAEIRASEQRLDVLAKEYGRAEDLQKESIANQIQAEQTKIEDFRRQRKAAIDAALSEPQAPQSQPAGDLPNTPGSTDTGKQSGPTAEDLELKRAQLRLAAMQDGIDKEIALEKFRFETLKAELDKYQLETEGAQAQHQDNLASIRAKYQAAKDAVAQAERDAADRAQVEALEREKAAFDERQRLYVLNFERRQQLEREKFFTVARTEEEITAFTEQQETARQIFILEQQKKLLEKLVDLGAARSDVELAIFKQTIDNIEGEIAAFNNSPEVTGAERGKGGKSIFALLGIDEEENPEAAQAIQEGVQFVIQQIQQLAEAKVEAARRAVDAARRETESAEDALQTELQLAELGFASNVDLKRKELAEKQQAEEEALAAQKKAQKEKLVLDTITQTVSLITASANIFQTLSAIPFVGIPLAIGVIASMFAAFAKTKSQALKAAKIARKGAFGRVGRDGVVVGERHEGGGVPLEVEDGEFFTTDGKRFGVVRREMKAAHFDLLQSVNDNDLPGMARYVNELLEGTGIGPVRDKATELAGKQAQGQRLEIQNRIELEQGELRENNRLLARQVALAEAQARGRKVDYLPNGSRVETAGASKRIVKAL